jgi:phage FluMu gp28-like protein
MSALLPNLPIGATPTLARCLTPYQIHWILADEILHARGKQSFALAEKSVRIGWTFADSIKNVRKRLWHKNRDYLFATKDYPSALEYIRLCHKVAELFNLTRSIISHGEEYHKLPRLDEHGRTTNFTDELKMGVIKFDNGSRILAFSSHPQAMAVYAGDVGLDEFAKHQNAKLLWETAQGRVTWGYDMAVWSSHDGEDTLFNEFAHEARTHATTNLEAILARPVPGLRWTLQKNSWNQDSLRLWGDPATAGREPPYPTPRRWGPSSVVPTKEEAYSRAIPCNTLSAGGEGQGEVELPALADADKFSPWNLYYRVTLPDAIDLGLLEVINRVQRTSFTPSQFIADCRARSRQEEIFQQTYLCNPLGASTNHIVEWSAIEKCRYDYEILRVHLEQAQIIEKFGEFHPQSERNREDDIEHFIDSQFRPLYQPHPRTKKEYRKFRLGFDVAASGHGDLASIYIDEADADTLELVALFTCRTEDWHFIKTVLHRFMSRLRTVYAAGDANGLGSQICWEARGRFHSRFDAVTFSSEKHNLGFALMNQLATAQKRFPRDHQDIAADFFALRKSFQRNRWVFSESKNPLNAASHCDIAWAAALATWAHTENRHYASAACG